MLKRHWVNKLKTSVLIWSFHYFLDGMKSSNEIVKTDAFGLFQALCLKSADEECLLSVVGIMIKNMSSGKYFNY